MMLGRLDKLHWCRGVLAWKTRQARGLPILIEQRHVQGSMNIIVPLLHKAVRLPSIGRVLFFYI